MTGSINTRDDGPAMDGGGNVEKGTLTDVISWLRYRREEARNAQQEDAANTIDMLLDEARESYHTGTPLPQSAWGDD